ncbi:MAG: type IV secretory system conjugative DNA transfer family protein [Bifidobacteriaceae bacterium]|jgi:type IV secretion system protein VirD4|nr:type IV secretory system conjugative DNA transfer family protein [Bifidobacteriaceae bacterium]
MAKGLATNLRNMTTLAMTVLTSLLLLFIIINILNLGLSRGFAYAKNMLASQRPIDLVFFLYVDFLRNWRYIFLNLGNFARYPSFFLRNILSFVIPFATYIAVFLKYRKQILEWEPFQESSGEFANAHWATVTEMKKAKLFEKKGFMLGKYKGQYLIEYSFQHILLFAPTGSGKGVGFVIPNLLFWDESVIVHDIKLENYERTSGYRYSVMKQKVFLWNPADQKGVTHCYNPMDWVARDMGGLVDDVQKIAKFLLPKEEFWTNEARALTVGLMLSLYADPSRPTTLGEVLRLIRSEDLAYSLAVMLDTFGGSIHPVSYMNLNAFLNKADKERSGVCSTASSSLELWSNPFVDTATSKSHLNIGTFRTVPTSLFVGISPNNIERLRPLLQIFYQQCATIFTNKMPTKSEKKGVLMLLDEFPTLGELNEIKIGIAYYRGYKVKLFLVVQDTEQLKDIYKDAGMNSFFANSYYRITFSANTQGTAAMISRLLGKMAVESTADKVKSKYIDLNPGAKDSTVRKVERDLLKEQEILTLPRDDEIILIESNSPVRCKKIKYFEDKLFQKRVDMKMSYVPTQPVFIKSKEENNENIKEDKK